MIISQVSSENCDDSDADDDNTPIAKLEELRKQQRHCVMTAAE